MTKKRQAGSWSNTAKRQRNLCNSSPYGRGICTPEILKNIAQVAEKYNAKAIKVTGAQRLAIVGLNEQDLEKVWKELEMGPGAAVGMCVRSVKFCPGTILQTWTAGCCENGYEIR